MHTASAANTERLARAVCDFRIAWRKQEPAGVHNARSSS